MRRLLITCVILFAFITNTNAQEWLTDFSKAKELSKTENKNIVLVFQGGDWCIPCIKLEKEIWNTEIFKKAAKENFVMLQANFPRKRKNKLSKKLQESNAKLFEKYNTKGIFPLVVVLNQKGEVLGETGYKKMNATEYVQLLQSFKN